MRHESMAYMILYYTHANIITRQEEYRHLPLLELTEDLARWYS